VGVRADRAGSRSPRARHGLAALVVVLASLTVGTLAAAGTGTSGNGAAIALYRVAARATNALPAYVISQHGYVRINDSIGKHRRTEWAWGQDQFQSGEVATTERLVLVQRHGSVAWIEDTLHPDVKCDSGGTCPAMLPLQFFITPTRAYVGIISSSSSTTAACFTRESLADVPYAAGISWWWAVGSFAPEVKDGALTKVTATYPNSGQAETETDWIANATKLFAKSVFSVAKSGAHRAFRFTASYSRLSTQPSTPHITICS
jgi:hypothetical protein